MPPMLATDSTSPRARSLFPSRQWRLTPLRTLRTGPIIDPMDRADEKVLEYSFETSGGGSQGPDGRGAGSERAGPAPSAGEPPGITNGQGGILITMHRMSQGGA